MADGYLPGEGGYIYSPIEPHFIFPPLRDQYTSPYLDDLDIEAQRLHSDSKPYCPDERSPLLENSALPQQKVSKRFDLGISKLSFLWSCFVGSCFGHEIAEIQDIEELERKYEIQSRELDEVRRERDNLKRSLRQEEEVREQKLENLKAKYENIIDRKEAEWSRSMETTSLQLQDEESKVEAISSQLQDEKARVEAISSLLEDEKSKAEAISSLLQDEKSKAEAISSQLQDEKSKVEAISSQLQDQKSKVETVLSQLQDEKSKVKAISSQLQDEKSKAEAITSQLQGEKSKVAAISSQLQGQKSKVAAIQSQLRGQKSEVAKLQKYIEKNEKVVTKAHETHVSSLSKSVSRPLTDDVIKDELKRFYENAFLSWCGDLGSMEICEPEKAKEKLQSIGVINSSRGYMSEPAYLQFSMDLPDGRSPVVLLQAVLSQTLCQTFLRDAYFLADGMETPNKLGQDLADSRRRLKELEDMLCKVDKSFGVDWRIQTVESLERATPFGLHLVENKAKRFVQDFHFLLKDVDDHALKDLAQLFHDFGSIALKLWKLRTVIKAHGLSRFAEQRFDAGSSFIEADFVGSPAARRRLQGRYVGVVVRPLIISEPLGQDGEASKEVVWLKAAGWVSDFDSVDDVMRMMTAWSFK